MYEAWIFLVIFWGGSRLDIVYGLDTQFVVFSWISVFSSSFLHTKFGLLFTCQVQNCPKSLLWIDQILSPTSSFRNFAMGHQIWSWKNGYNSLASFTHPLWGPWTWLQFHLISNSFNPETFTIKATWHVTIRDWMNIVTKLRGLVAIR